jgi:hypothetical protein
LSYFILFFKKTHFFFDDLKKPIFDKMSNGNYEIYKIKELDPDIIAPSTKDYKGAGIEKGGSKIVVIGKPGTGKTTLIASLLYAKKHIFPVGTVISGTEDSNGFYKKIFPSTFVYNKYSEPIIEKFIQRQKLARKHISNPWAVLLLDDCTDTPSVFRRPVQMYLFKNGRHLTQLFILSLQFCLDILPAIRTNIDGVFLLRESNLRNRKTLYENYAGIIPDFSLFCDIMDQITDDYTALYIHNRTVSNNWHDCVFWYKAPNPDTVKDFRFGCDEYWDFHEQRYNPNYVDPMI